MRSIGSIVVVGEGVAHVDVAGSPLQFVVAAVGATPPPSCLTVVAGSDGSGAVVQVTYSNDPVTGMRAVAGSADNYVLKLSMALNDKK